MLKPFLNYSGSLQFNILLYTAKEHGGKKTLTKTTTENQEKQKHCAIKEQKPPFRRAFQKLDEC